MDGRGNESKYIGTLTVPIRPSLTTCNDPQVPRIPLVFIAHDLGGAIVKKVGFQTDSDNSFLH